MSLVIRRAEISDLRSIIALFANDYLGGHGDTTDADALPQYRTAFDAIIESDADDLYVATLDGAVVGTFQITWTWSMPGRGTLKQTIEAVQVVESKRGQGFGEAMVRHALQLARERGASRVQLMSNSSRTDAHRFYERLGFVKSHAGFKLKL